MKNLELKKMSLSNIEDTLSVSEMEEIMAGSFDCSASAQKKYSTIGLVFGILSFAGPIGAIAFGPTAIAMSAASTYCAYQ